MLLILEESGNFGVLFLDLLNPMLKAASSCFHAHGLSAGTYFAKNSGYSSEYSNKASRAALIQAEIRYVQQQSAKGQTSCPAFLADGKAMLLCRVALGKAGKGNSSLLRPPPGFDSVYGGMFVLRSDVFAVFDNNQSYPEYIIHHVP